MALGFGGAWAKVVRRARGKTHVDETIRISVAKLYKAPIHKHWTNTSSVITSAAINKSNIFSLN